MNDVNQSNTLEARVAKLERAARRWRVGFAALCLVVVGMGAYAVNDAEFGTVRAKRFSVIGEGGEVVAELTSGKGPTTKKDEGALILTGDERKKLTLVRAGVGELKYENNSDE